MTSYAGLDVSQQETHIWARYQVPLTPKSTNYT